MDADRKDFIETSLVMVGEIGGNDYKLAFFPKKEVELAHSIIPKVIQVISSTINVS